MKPNFVKTFMNKPDKTILVTGTAGFIGFHLANRLLVEHKGYRGFGGKCLPKDLKTFIKVFKANKVRPSLFEIVDQMNEKLLKDQMLTETLNKYWLNNANPKNKMLCQKIATIQSKYSLIGSN